MSLENLWNLQQLELKKEQEKSQIDRQVLKDLKGEKKAILAREEELNKEKNDCVKLKRELFKKEQDLDYHEDRKKELTAELYSGTMSNPKELSHLEEQLGNLESQIDVLIEAFLGLEEKRSKKEEGISVKDQKLVTDKDIYNRKAQEFKKEWDAEQVKLGALNEEIKALEAKVSPETLEQYHRLQKRLGVIALVGVENGFCSGCGIQLSSFLYQQVKLGELANCENCGRLLLLPTSFK